MTDQNVLQRFKNISALVMGDVFLDEYIMGDCERLSPEAPVPILTVNNSHTVLGGAANTSANIASLGASVTLIGLIGKDDNAILFKSRAKKQGIKFCPITDGRPTIKKTRILGKNQQLLRIDFEETNPISPDTEKKILNIFNSRLKSCDVVVLSDYAKGFFSKELCGKIISASRRAGKIIIIDPKPANALFYKNCDVITPNWQEALSLAGFNPAPISMELVRRTAVKLQGLYKCGILLTLGSKGLFYLNKKTKKGCYLPAETRDVFDVSGAGDTVVAVFALGQACGLSDEESIEYANKAAGVVVGKMGTGLVYPEELRETKSGLNILTRKELSTFAQNLKKQNKIIVTVNGSFDLLHNGHLHILKEAKKQGDILIVGLNSDKSIKKYKGKNRPIISENQRAEMLLALEYVDYIHIFNETVPMNFLALIKPHIHVNGSEYGKNCIEAETVKKHGGKIVIVKIIKGLSTSDVVERILKSSV